LARLVLPIATCVLLSGVVVGWLLVGAKAIAVAEPLDPQPYPRTRMPTSGQVARPALVGAVVVLAGRVFATVAWLVMAGAMFA
jgi:hypothetical protein